jgi:hypothetical protein
MGTSKFTFVMWAFLFLGGPLFAADNSYTLAEALQKKMATVTIVGNNDAVHSFYGQCIMMRIKNTSNQNLSLKLEPGRRLNCDYDSVQDMMVTQAEIFALLPSQSKEFFVYAMCCEKSNRSPGKSSSYSLGAMANSSLAGLAKLIDDLDAQDMSGQHAVWVLTDNADPEGIVSDNAAITKALKEFVITALKSQSGVVREPGFIYDYSYPENNGKAFTIEGDFSWEMPYGSFVSLYLYDNNGNRMQVVFQDVAFTSGLKTYHYKITSDALQSGNLYWIRMKMNNKTLKELAVTMD